MDIENREMERMERKENKTKKEIILGVPDGGFMMFPLEEGDSLGGWQQRAHEINTAEGWLHYTIACNRKSRMLTIYANER